MDEYEGDFMELAETFGLDDDYIRKSNGVYSLNTMAFEKNENILKQKGFDKNYIYDYFTWVVDEYFDCAVSCVDGLGEGGPCREYMEVLESMYYFIESRYEK